MPSTTYYSRTKKEKTYYDKMRRAKENNDMISFQKNKELFLEARYNRYEKENLEYRKKRDIAELDEQERKNKENVPIKNWSEEVKKIKKEIDVLEEKHYTMLDNREDTTEIISTLKTMYLRLEKAREKRDKEKSSKNDEVYMSERSLPKIKLKYE